MGKLRERERGKEKMRKLIEREGEDEKTEREREGSRRWENMKISVINEENKIMRC